MCEDYEAKISYQHDVVCNQKYNENLPYSFHLKAVHSMAIKYNNLIPYAKRDIVYIAAFGHDLIEDARMTFNDVKEMLNSWEIADIIYLCTEEKGKNRSDRHNSKFFLELSTNRLAVYVKLCDIMANVLFSLITNSSMIRKYKDEFKTVKDYLYKEGEYDKLWEDLEKLLSI